MVLTLLQVADAISKLHHPKWFIHERVLARKLGITLEQLHGVVRCLREGGVSSSSSSNTFCSNPPPYDTKIDIFSGSEDNPLNLHGTRYGRKTSGSGLVQDTEKEPSTDVLLERSTFFRTGTLASHDKQVTIQRQKDLALWIIGEHKDFSAYDAKYVSERQEIWRAWALGTSDELAALYDHDHFIHIAWKFSDCFSMIENKPSPSQLARAKEEVVAMLVDMFILPPPQTDTTITTMMTRQRPYLQHYC